MRETSCPRDLECSFAFSTCMIVTCELATLHALSWKWFVMLLSPVLILMNSRILQPSCEVKFSCESKSNFRPSISVDYLMSRIWQQRGMLICIGVKMRLTEIKFRSTLEVSRTKSTERFKQTLAFSVNCHRIMMMTSGPEELKADIRANIYHHPLLNSLNFIKDGSSHGGTSKGLQ